MHTRTHVAAASLIFTALALSTTANAEPTAPDKAAADALFTEARELLDAGRAAEACPKLEESQRLDPAVGTALNLADCYERIGHTASAYLGFGDAAALARRTGDSERAAEADRRADALQPKLVRIAVNVPESSRIKGLVVLRDGQPVASTLWGTPIPVDPGEHVIEAKAIDRIPWKTTLKLEVPGTTELVAVPVLAEIEHPINTGKTAQRVAGIVVGSLGLATFGVSGGFAIAAARKDSESKEHCTLEDQNLCYSHGVALRQESIGLANIATGIAAAGGVVLATGVTLFLLAGSPKSPDKPATAWVVVPRVAPREAGLVVGGMF